MSRRFWKHCPRFVLFSLGDALRAFKRLSKFLENENILLAFTVLCGCLQFCPLFGNYGNYDDYFHTNMDPEVFSHDRFYLTSLIIIPAAVAPTFLDAFTDLMVEGFELLSARRAAAAAESKKSVVEMTDRERSEVKTTRLTAAERFIFTIGVSMQPLVMLLCCYSFAQGKISPGYWACVWKCTESFKLIVTFAPIISFLQRCTTTFTPLSCAAVMFVICFASLAQMFRYLFPLTFPTPGKPPVYSGAGEAISSVTNAIIYVSAVMYVYLCVRSLWGYIAASSQWQRFRLAAIPTIERDTTTVQSENEHQVKTQESTEDDIERKIRMIDFYYTNNVPAVHMICCFLMVIGVTTPDTVDADAQKVPTVFIASNLIMFIMTVIVVFIENRVRHNEVERNMLRTISSVKKSYVRYLR